MIERNFAIFFDGRAWLVIEKHGENTTATMQCQTLELAMKEVYHRTGAPAGIKVLTF